MIAASSSSPSASRWLVVLLFVAVALSALWSLRACPIDAVPDITNNQVQINTVAPALSPVEMEKQVTFPIETALAGTPASNTPARSRATASAQVTAVFGDKANIYFARQQVTSACSKSQAALPPGAEPSMGPISTGLGEIYMWTVEYQTPRPEAPVDVTASRAGRATAAISLRKASVCAPISSARPISARSRTGSSGRSSKACRASRASMRSAVTSSNTRCSQTRRS